MSCIRVHHVGTTSTPRVCIVSTMLVIVWLYFGYCLVILWLLFGCTNRLISSEEKGISSEVICISSEEKGITSEETAISSEEIRRKNPDSIKNRGTHVNHIIVASTRLQFY